MENEFVPFELAVKLKELGFNEPCFGYFSKDKNNKLVSVGQIAGSDFHLGMLNKHLVYEMCAAPLWQQAFDWFRETHNLVSDPIPYYGAPNDRYFHGWQPEVYELKTGDILTNNGGYFMHKNEDGFNKARTACLEKLIEITTP